MLDISLALQIVACLTTLAATWMIGNKATAGPALNIAAALCFAVVNAYAGLWLCSAFSMTMAATNVRNCLKWHREKRA